MIRVAPGELDGTVLAPRSKSVTQRALVAAALAEGTSVIRAPSVSADAQAAASALRALGAEISQLPGEWRVKGGLGHGPATLDCGESALTMRMLAPVAALRSAPVILSASGSLANRPMDMVVDALRQLGADCWAEGGRPPLHVRGPLRGGKAALDGSVTSQLLTGVLLALPRAQGDSDLRVRDLRSRPYVAMTLEVIDACGGQIDVDRRLGRFRIPGGQRYRPLDLTVEADWSAAAFLLVAGAIAGHVGVRGLRMDTLQADRAILNALVSAGAELSVGTESVEAEQGFLRGFAMDLSECPDLLPPAIALATYCRGRTRLVGTGRSRYKESSRAEVLASELGKLGAKIRVYADAVEVTGGRLSGGRVASHADHRIAMACAVAALGADGEVEIDDESCVAKSYPGFFEDLASIRTRTKTTPP